MIKKNVVCTYVYVKVCTYHDLYGITLLFTHTCEYYHTQFYIHVGTYNSPARLTDEMNCAELTFAEKNYYSILEDKEIACVGAGVGG